ncbi:hypothetical protein BK809_0004568 [Diplodia seriata]|uniref:GFO/IDH/MocA-like oxidoreductase domain-containing protein n=1 Tax=Diplodia seriata TaxID=420778 RepID=A0A1S8B6N2_9PEZI|nr:hypothetical protein BK809_0004568 [Diplodia seriata]
MHIYVKEGSKYHATSWRKNPTFQGGFLLDGGVHFIAATRLLLSSSVDSVSAFTAQHLPHLPPVDTVDAVWRLPGGGAGTFSTSFAAPVGGPPEYRVVCERGTVTAGFGAAPMSPAFVAVQRVGEEGGEGERKEFPETSFGVGPEVAAWGGRLEKGGGGGGVDERQKPEEALKDLEIVCAAATTLVVTEMLRGRVSAALLSGSADTLILVGGDAEERRARGSPGGSAVLNSLSWSQSLLLQEIKRTDRQ